MAKIFGKKDDGVSQDATVSSIPVPPSDSALVIDLPEGQKLVIGKMEEGTVIEVATWRGTGRPDSRTNRLMLGVSFGGTQTPESSNEDELIPSMLPAYQRYLYLLKQRTAPLMNNVKASFGQLKPLTIRAVQKLKGAKVGKGDKGIREISQGFASERDFDIDKWLESVRGNSRVTKLSEGGKVSSRTPSRSQKVKAGQASQKSASKPRKSSSSRPSKRK